jgi:hypothetical protein
VAKFRTRAKKRFKRLTAGPPKLHHRASFGLPTEECHTSIWEATGAPQVLEDIVVTTLAGVIRLWCGSDSFALSKSIVGSLECPPRKLRLHGPPTFYFDDGAASA